MTKVDAAQFLAQARNAEQEFANLQRRAEAMGAVVMGDCVWMPEDKTERRQPWTPPVLGVIDHEV